MRIIFQCIVISIIFCIRLEGYAQVNLQTGSATFNLPLFKWQDNQSALHAVVELDYNSGQGLKVDELPSWVGQGWRLIAGGVISRMQLGEPDDQKKFPATDNQGDVFDWRKIPAGYLYNPQNITDGCPVVLSKYPIFPDANVVYKPGNKVMADREMDYFAFQFNGRVGLFVINKNSANGNTFQGHVIGESRLKITCVTDMNIPNTRTTIKSFSIQDENGLIYKFGSVNSSFNESYVGKTQVMKMSYGDKYGIAKIKQPEFEHDHVYHEWPFTFEANDNVINPNIITDWYLSEIEDGLTGRKITFSYNKVNITSQAGYSLAYFEEPQFFPVQSIKKYAVITHKRSVASTSELASISFPDGHQVLFNAPDERVDLPGTHVLSSIDVKYNDAFLSRHELTTSYFILNRYGNPVSEYQKGVARLCLTAVTQYGQQLLAAVGEPYRFDYYMGSNIQGDFVPPPFTYLKDISGHYNADMSRSYSGAATGLVFTALHIQNPWLFLTVDDIAGLCYLRNGNANAVNSVPKNGYAKNGLLKQVSFPSGAYFKYEYEQNTALINGTNKDVGGVHVSKTITIDPGYSNDCDHPLVTNYNYVQADGLNSSMWGIENAVNSMTIQNHYRPESKKFYVDAGFVWFEIGCRYGFIYPGILEKEQAISLPSLSTFMSVLTQVLNSFGSITTVVDVITLIAKSTPAAWAAVILDVFYAIVNIVITCFNGDGSMDTAVTVFYNYDLNSVNALPAQFARVEVINGSGGQGKTVYEFTSPATGPGFTVWEPMNTKFSNRQRFASWLYGLPSKITLYDAANIPVKQTEYEYETNMAYTKKPIGQSSCMCRVTKNVSLGSDAYPDRNNNPSYTTNSNGEIEVDIYPIYTGWAPLIKTKEKNYKQGANNQFAEMITTYSYNILNNEVNHIEATESNGDIRVKDIKFSVDFNTGVLSTLNQKNILATPVAETNSIKKKDVSGNYTTHYLNETATEFTVLPNGNIKPYRTLVQRTSEPKISNVWMAYNPVNTVGFKEVQQNIYDAVGNLVGIRDEGGRNVSNIYGYDDKFLIASVVNADILLDKPAYTSFETNLNSCVGIVNNGGWLISGSPTFDCSQSVTGKRSLTLSQGIVLSAPVNRAKAYYVSFWAVSGSYNINGLLKKSSPTINGFTYYEYLIPAGTTEIVLSGTGNIDELRAYPENARMRTVTYDPLVGKTSEADENSRIKYYDYDELGRVRLIKDENRDIIKMYAYNNETKYAACSTYYNKKISETFIKEGCDEDHYGSELTYVVNENAYSSPISQQAADLKAEMELASYGQKKANEEGVCLPYYFNASISQDFYPTNCSSGTTASAVTYTVPAKKYKSKIQGEADQMALADIKANGPAYANLYASLNGTCINYGNPVWEVLDPLQDKCEDGYYSVLCIDVNDKSPSYNTTKWLNLGLNSEKCETSCTDCKGIDKRCIQGICETGILVFIDSYVLNGKWICVYHYEFSDGSHSPAYEITGANYEGQESGCPIPSNG